MSAPAGPLSLAEEILTAAEVAAPTKVPASTLRAWRHYGTAGPTSFELGARVYYRRADVDSWLAAQYAATASNRPRPDADA